MAGEKHDVGIVSNIQKYTIHDGPGIRTEIFFKGCNMHCLWCSNPEAINPMRQLGVYPVKCVGCGSCVQVCPQTEKPIHFSEGRISGITAGRECSECLKCADVCPGRAIKVWGDVYTVPQLMEIIEQDRTFYEKSGGGVTVSGGEVMLQWQFVEGLLKACRQAKIHTCVESALHCPVEHLDALLPYTDLIISDIKHMDAEKHRKYTGLGNERILENIKHLSESGKPFLIRTPVVPDFNDTQEEIEAIARFIGGLANKPLQYQLLPYRKMGTEKHESLGQHYPLGDDYVPPERTVWEAKLSQFVSVISEKYHVKASAGYNQKYL